MQQLLTAHLPDQRLWVPALWQNPGRKQWIWHPPGPMRRLIVPLVVVGLTIAVVVGVLQAGTAEEGGRTVDPAEARQRLAGAPAPLAALHEQGSQLLGGGPSAFERRLEALRGYPVVVNKWGSWCGPCRAEFPLLARQAVKHGKRVAFLGLDVEDGRGPAEEFLAEAPVPYPSYEDPDGQAAAELGIPKIATPTTVFIDSRGKVVERHFGQYRREAELEAEIERFAR